eukprot:1162110-Pelagomonas_calceolata.AAC.2
MDLAVRSITVVNSTPSGIKHTGVQNRRGDKKRKVYASQVQLRALRKGSLTSKLARASPRRLTGLA